MKKEKKFFPSRKIILPSRKKPPKKRHLFFISENIKTSLKSKCLLLKNRKRKKAHEPLVVKRLFLIFAFSIIQIHAHRKQYLHQHHGTTLRSARQELCCVPAQAPPDDSSRRHHRRTHACTQVTCQRNAAQRRCRLAHQHPLPLPFPPRPEEVSVLFGQDVLEPLILFVRRITLSVFGRTNHPQNTTDIFSQ